MVAFPTSLLFRTALLKRGMLTATSSGAQPSHKGSFLRRLYGLETMLKKALSSMSYELGQKPAARLVGNLYYERYYIGDQ